MKITFLTSLVVLTVLLCHPGTGLPAAEIEGVLSDTPKRLEVEYFYPIKDEDFGPATNKVMAQNVDAETFERLKPLVEKSGLWQKEYKPWKV